MRPGLSQRHSVRTSKWYPVADAERTGLRLRHALLAAFTRLAARWNLGHDHFVFAELAFHVMARSTGHVRLLIALRTRFRN
jgi:hypothetical protein